MGFVDFAALKDSVAIETVVPLLGIDMKQFNNQWRGQCPACRSGGNRALVITPEKSAFYCFGGRTGGDVIAFVAHIRSCSMKDAAIWLEEQMGEGSSGRRAKATVPEERPREDARSLQPLTYLQPEHEAVQALGVSPETCTLFGAGYARKGIMRGRLAIPVHDRTGTLIAYCGQAVKGESPALIFPNGFVPQEHIFNAHTLEPGEGEIVLARDPLEVMIAAQNGIGNSIAFLTETVQPQQLEMLASLMDTLQCEELVIA